MSAFEVLEHHYRDRRRAARDSGRKVVALAGTTVPVELVLAAGAFPVSVAPLERAASPRADRYLEAHFDGEVRSILEAVLAGAWDWVDLLVLPRTSDGYLELYYVMKELVRLGEGRAVPPLHLFDMLHGQSEANRAYGLERTAALARRLGAATGIAPTGDRLRGAVAAVNRQRAAVRRLQEARRDPAAGISGTAALVATGAGRFMDPNAHAEALDAFLGEPRPALAPGPRLLVVAAEPLSDLRLYTALEATGAVVVAEDDAWGARAGGADVDASAPDLAAAVFDKYFADVPSPRLAPHAARDRWLRAEIDRGGFEAAVFHVPQSDTWFGWDYPRLRDLCQQAGIRPVMVRDLDQAAAVGSELAKASTAR